MYTCIHKSRTGDCKRSGETLRQGGDKEDNGTRVTWKGVPWAEVLGFIRWQRVRWSQETRQLMPKEGKVKIPLPWSGRMSSTDRSTKEKIRQVCEAISAKRLLQAPGWIGQTKAARVWANNGSSLWADPAGAARPRDSHSPLCLHWPLCSLILSWFPLVILCPC